MRAARTPPEPPPITNRSTSKSAISSSTRSLSLSPLDLLAALAHLGAELSGDKIGEFRRPLVHRHHAHLDGLRLGRKQLRSERRLVEGDEILDLLVGELVAVGLRHLLADLLLLAGEGLRDDHRDLVEVLLVVEIGLEQRLLGLL